MAIRHIIPFLLAAACSGTGTDDTGTGGRAVPVHSPAASADASSASSVSSAVDSAADASAVSSSLSAFIADMLALPEQSAPEPVPVSASFDRYFRCGEFNPLEEHLLRTYHSNPGRFENWIVRARVYDNSESAVIYQLLGKPEKAHEQMVEKLLRLARTANPSRRDMLPTRQTISCLQLDTNAIAYDAFMQSENPSMVHELLINLNFDVPEHWYSRYADAQFEKARSGKAKVEVFDLYGWYKSADDNQGQERVIEALAFQHGASQSSPLGDNNLYSYDTTSMLAEHPNLPASRAIARHQFVRCVTPMSSPEIAGSSIDINGYGTFIYISLDRETWRQRAESCMGRNSFAVAYDAFKAAHDEDGMRRAAEAYLELK